MRRRRMAIGKSWEWRNDHTQIGLLAPCLRDLRKNVEKNFTFFLTCY